MPMLVRTLVAWAGLDFAVAPGEVVELPEEVALARIAAGLAEAAEAPPAAPAPPESPPPPKRR